MTTKIWRRLKQQIKELTANGYIKSPCKEIFDNYREEVREARALERMHAKGAGDFFIYDKDGEGYTRIYAAPVTHGGTKEELLRYLWEEHATEIYGAYDCTGREFTTHFKVAHLRGDLWKVAEHFSLDV